MLDKADSHRKQNGKEEAEHLYSRLMTKKQLNQMAMGVRKLSKKLGSVRLKFKVRTVFLLTKIFDESLVGRTRNLVRWLLSQERDTPYIVSVLLRWLVWWGYADGGTATWRIR